MLPVSIIMDRIHITVKRAGKRYPGFEYASIVSGVEGLHYDQPGLVAYIGERLFSSKGTRAVLRNNLPEDEGKLRYTIDNMVRWHNHLLALGTGKFDARVHADKMLEEDDF